MGNRQHLTSGLGPMWLKIVLCEDSSHLFPWRLTGVSVLAAERSLKQDGWGKGAAGPAVQAVSFIISGLPPIVRQSPMARDEPHQSLLFPLCQPFIVGFRMAVLVLSQPHVRQWFPFVARLLKDYISFGARNPSTRRIAASQSNCRHSWNCGKCFLGRLPCLNQWWHVPLGPFCPFACLF